jgi:hypothetical protein
MAHAGCHRQAVVMSDSLGLSQAQENQKFDVLNFDLA